MIGELNKKSKSLAMDLMYVLISLNIIDKIGYKDLEQVWYSLNIENMVNDYKRLNI